MPVVSTTDVILPASEFHAERVEMKTEITSLKVTEGGSGRGRFPGILFDRRRDGPHKGT